MATLTSLPHTNTLVTLTVDTTTINQSNKNSKVTFSDNQGDPGETPGQPRNYESSVNKGAQITWKGEAANDTDTVNITVVSKKTSGGGSSILVTPIGPPTSGQVTANVINSQVTGDENYNVTFDVIRNNVTTGYSIDPKLKMNPPE